MFWMIIYFRRGPWRAAAKTVVVHYTGGPPAPAILNTLYQLYLRNSICFYIKVLCVDNFYEEYKVYVTTVMSVFRIRLFQFVLFECGAVAESILSIDWYNKRFFGDCTGIRLNENEARVTGEVRIMPLLTHNQNKFCIILCTL